MQANMVLFIHLLCVQAKLYDIIHEVICSKYGNKLWGLCSFHFQRKMKLINWTVDVWLGLWLSHGVLGRNHMQLILVYFWTDTLMLI